MLTSGMEYEYDDEELSEKEWFEIRRLLRRVRNGTETLTPIEVVEMHLIKDMSRIRAWRLHRKMSIIQLAKRVKKRAAYIAQIENGTRKGTVATMAALAKALGTTIDGLRG